MKHTRAIYWHQGMFLQPQHFQLAERSLLLQHKPVTQSGLPHFWGVGELALSAAAVANHRIEIQSATLLFPDQSYVEYPGNAVIADRAFDAAQVRSDRPLRVYLGLRRFSADGGNVGVAAEFSDSALAGTRYAATWRADDVGDLYGEGPAAQVRALVHVVRVFFEHELDALQDYELIPIATLLSDGSSVRLAEDYAPPCYTLTGAPALQQEVKDIRDELAGRARQLQAYKRPQDGQRMGGDGGSDVALLLALRSLNRFCPLLQHVCEDVRVHPWHVYGLLRQVVGELSSFSERYNMFGEGEDGSPGLPAYDHRDLRRCFLRAHQLISHLLNEITVGAEFIVPLTSDGAGLHTGVLPKRFFTEHNRFYLMLHSPQAGDEVARAVAADARLGPTEEMPKLLSLALPGLELIHLAAAPRGLPRRADAHYFRIEQISRQWEVIERDGQIALAWVDPPEGLRADVVVVRR